MIKPPLRNIKELEMELLSFNIRNNPIRLDELLADNIMEFGASGSLYDKKILIDSLPKQEKFHYNIYDFIETQLSPETVHVTYRLEKGSVFSLRSSIWRLNQNQWQMIFHQGTNQSKNRII